MDPNKRAYSLKQLEDDLRDPMSAQRATLKQIFTSLQSTSYLRKHGIGPETTLEEFTDIYPITTYDDYEALVNAVADKEAEPSELIGIPSDNDDDALLGFFLTSGTSRGRNKLIPKLKRDLLHRISAFGLAAETLKKEGVAVGGQGFRSLSASQKGIIIRTKSGLLAGGANSMYLADPKNHPMLQKTMVSLVEIVLLDSPHTVVVYSHLLVALTRREEVGRINNAYANQTLELCVMLEEKCDLLVNQLRHGISQTVEGLVDDESLKILQPILGDGRPDLADFVERECGLGFEGILTRLFPNCEYLSMITSGAMLPYTEKVKRYTAGKIPMISSIYGASEAVIGLNMDPLQKLSDAPLYTLLPRSTSLLEFQPFPNDDEDSPVTMDKVKIGGVYEVIVTSSNCLFRYRLGDVVRVVKFQHKTPAVEFLHRSSAVLSLSNELMTERHLMDAVSRAQAKVGVHIKDFVFDGDMDCIPPRYVMYYEKGGDVEFNARISGALDEALHDENSNYSLKRSQSRLGEVRAIEVEKSTFGRYKAVMLKAGTDPGQYKAPRVVNNERLRAMLLEASLGEPMNTNSAEEEKAD